ncbi:bifunctional methylenetetrahydrofolate dehydrogenase/methenyltetrahydrofolate cyclohydrolase FolD [Candidatus Binatia bacterium]|jgi:methylenetetrahydrofolate dehydrogenase (NADP+)/methenyltetrahydrofolate cyclohydrolase|nr:bifunctional methylenetetrahydrofolate dehydrogenase/methenyltetrahydrofolate cyclohydrolase FolD [Candidatus Binatia bacterium]
MARVIDGKAIGQKVRDEVKTRVAELKARGVEPGLATVLVGDDPASAIYVRMKKKACLEAGMSSFGIELPASTTEAQLLEVVDGLNTRRDVHGILVQLPVPEHIEPEHVIDRIAPAKDVDGLHAVSRGRLVAGVPGLRPATPLGCIRLLDEIGCDPKGKNAVVIGRSLLVGKPVALLLLERHATVTICHSRTKDLAAEIARADIVVAAIGKAGAIKGEWIKPGAVVIDVGTNRTEQGLVGDVEYAEAAQRASAITPVPGGVGPMTIAMLLSNTAQAAATAAGL